MKEEKRIQKRQREGEVNERIGGFGGGVNERGVEKQ